MMEPGATRPEAAATTQQPCPKCQATLPVHQGYVTWCDSCGWNLKPTDTAQPRNILESFYVRMGERSGQRLFERLTHACTIQPILTLSEILAFAIAACVHGMTLAMLGLGLFLVLWGWPNCLAVGIGGLSIAIAWLLRPIFPHLTKKEKEKVVPRSTYPTLYALADQIAQTLHTCPVETIIVDKRINAGFRQVGWRRRRILFLGLPLLAILDGQELVALIGHELAHGVNRDQHRGFFVRTAIQALSQWYTFFWPERLFETSAPIEILAIPLKVLMVSMALAIADLINMLVRLNWHTAQHAEYLADALGAQVAGTEANLSLLSKLHYQRTFDLTLQQMSLRETQGDLFEMIRQQIAQVPDREVERSQRIEQLRKARFDTTHPPTVYRRDFLRAHPYPTPQIVLPAADFARIRQELAAIQAPIQAELLDLHQRSLYY